MENVMEREMVECAECGVEVEMDTATEVVSGHVCPECLESAYTECLECGELVPTDTTTEVEDGHVCSSCLREKYEECYECNEYFLRGGMTKDKDGDYYCESCAEEELIQCDDCGAWVVKGDAVTDRHHELCDECYEDSYQRCYECGDIEDSEDMVHIDGESYCECCAERNFDKCDDCGEYIDPDYSVSDDSKTLCESCYDNSYYRCYDCGDLVYYSDAEERNGYHYCRDCVPNDSIKEYDWVPYDFNFFGNSEVRMGIELEIDGAGEDDDNAQELIDIAGEDKLYCKHDGSLNDGFELVSHPCDLEYHLNDFPWEEVIRKAKNQGYESHDQGTCGLHVHISRDGLGDTYSEQDNTIMKMLYLFEKHWDKILRFSRRTAGQADEWACRYCESEYEKDRMNNMEWLAEHAKGDRSKYRAINLCHSKTVEIRIFRGSLRYRTFVATLQFCQMLVEICTTKSAGEVMEMTWDDVKGYGADYEEFMEYCERRSI